MSTIKKGMTKVDGEWRKHLRKDGRRIFWGKQRKDFQRDTKARLNDR